MKITIDTKEESAEDIKKLVELLTNFVEKKEIVSNRDIFKQPGAPQENILGSVFGAGKEEKKTAKKEEEEDEDPQVEVLY